MRTLKTSINESEYEEVLRFCKEQGMSVYGLVKTAVFEYMEDRLGHPIRQPRRARQPLVDSDLVDVSRLCEEHGIALGPFLKDALTSKLEAMKKER